LVDWHRCFMSKVVILWWLVIWILFNSFVTLLELLVVYVDGNSIKLLSISLGCLATCKMVHVYCLSLVWWVHEQWTHPTSLQSSESSVLPSCVDTKLRAKNDRRRWPNATLIYGTVLPTSQKMRSSHISYDYILSNILGTACYVYQYLMPQHEPTVSYQALCSTYPAFHHNCLVLWLCIFTTAK